MEKWEKPYEINATKNDIIQANDGSTLSTSYAGVEIWLPTWFRGLPQDIRGGVLFMPYTVVRITGKKTIVKTALAERKGTVKELYSLDDYKITIKGFLIDHRNRQWPSAELNDLKKLYELNQSVILDNALTNIFLERDSKVVIEDIDFPEVEGGRKHVRPFVMQMESDSVFTLEDKGPQLLNREIKGVL